MNPYEVLEISPGASAEEIKSAYHAAAKLWHPDRFTGEAKPEAERRFRLLAEAFNMLKDSGRREAQAPVPSPFEPMAQPARANPAPASAPFQSEPVPAVKSVEDWYQEAKLALDNKAYDVGMGLIQYAIRLEPERGEFHGLYGKFLELTGGDKRQLVRTLETAVRLNPKDVDSAVLLAQTFQGLGMNARATTLWNTVRSLAPNHPAFGGAPRKVEARKEEPAKGKAKAPVEAPSMGEQLSTLIPDLMEKFNKLFKRG